MFMFCFDLRYAAWLCEFVETLVINPGEACRAI